MNFGQWLRKTRLEQGLSQQGLADVTGIDRGHISKLENNRIDLPTYETRIRIHVALKTTDDDLVRDGVLAPRSEAEISAQLQDVEDKMEALSSEISFASRIPAHLRTSFLKAAEWSPEKQKIIIDLIRELDAGAQIQREELDRDKEG